MSVPPVVLGPTTKFDRRSSTDHIVDIPSHQVLSILSTHDLGAPDLGGIDIEYKTLRLNPFRVGSQIEAAAGTERHCYKVNPGANTIEG